MEWEWDIPHDPNYPIGHEEFDEDRDNRYGNKPVNPDNWTDDDITGG